jgi:hypothetical protein
MSAKSKLLAKNRKIIKTIEIETAEGPVPVQVRKPTMGDRLDTLERAREKKDLDENNEPTSPKAGLRSMARIAACVLYDPETGRPMFGEDDLDGIVDGGWLDEHIEDLQKAFNVAEVTVRGNSDATPG